MEGFVIGLGLSLHFGFTEDYNPINPYIEYQNNNLRIGVYYNSEENVSAYSGLNLTLVDDFSVDTGVVTGYFDYKVVPYAKFNYHYSNNVTLFATPGVETQQDNTTHYGIVSGITFNF
jgi:hypothetical protein